MPEIVHNTRSPEQWQIISKYIYFNGKTVLDLGCGYGDILAFCREAGAIVTGLERDMMVVVSAQRQHPGLNIRQGLAEFMPFGPFDVIICFSVLPYLAVPFDVLKDIWRNCKQALIECQYAGDGPGFAWLQNDDDMRRWLAEAGWQKIEAIGRTFVEGRDKFRTIWLCE